MQQFLLSTNQLLSLAVFNKFKLILSVINFPWFDNRPREGRPSFSHQNLLKALIYKSLRGLTSLSDLVSDLRENYFIAQLCGFDISQPLPSIQRFSFFMRNTENQLLQLIKKQLTQQLIELGVIKGLYCSIDSTPILANVKENNLKTNFSGNRFDKTKPPKGDPEARLGIIVTFPSTKPKISYFWGYRNHAVCDTDSELPIAEITKSANVHDSNLFVPLFSEIKKNFRFPLKGALGDAAYDSEHILKFVLKDLKVKPFISRNPRHKKSDFPLSSSGSRICISGFEMLYWGKFKDQNRTRIKFTCPILHSKKFAAKHSVCTMMHPNFFTGRGCTAYLRVDQDIREIIDYNSASFKDIRKKRSSSERVFSRLLSACLKNPSVIGLCATTNHCTIAHIAVLAVALAAASSNNLSQIRSVKSFRPSH